MGRGEKTTKSYLLSLIAGILIVCNSTLLGAAAMWFPGVIPILPGSTGNDTTFLFRLAAIGLLCGILVILGAVLLHNKPSKRKTWGD